MDKFEGTGLGRLALLGAVVRVPNEQQLVGEEEAGFGHDGDARQLDLIRGGRAVPLDQHHGVVETHRAVDL